MATTTNYSWSTPDDTALVKDGAAAIRSLGTAIDTTVFNNAGAAIAKTLIDAKGDLIVGSAADTAARLAAGTNGYLLSANSSATNGLEWVAAPASGGMTLLSTTTLSGSSTTISTISGSYIQLLIYGRGIYGSANDDFFVRFNSDTGSNYLSNTVQGTGSTSIGYSVSTGTSMLVGGIGTGSAWDQVCNFTTTIYRYAETEYKLITNQSAQKTSSVWQNRLSTNAYNSTTAISSLTYLTGSGTFSGGTVYVYGVK
jgi:hypothetical protein